MNDETLEQGYIEAVKRMLDAVDALLDEQGFEGSNPLCIAMPARHMIWVSTLEVEWLCKLLGKMLAAVASYLEAQGKPVRVEWGVLSFSEMSGFGRSGVS